MRTDLSEAQELRDVEVKSVVGYEGRYEVTRDGRVWSHISGRFLCGKKMGNYQGVSLYKDGQVKYCYIHRLVAAAFLGKCPKGREVDHIDRDKENNHAENLRYVTRRVNKLNVEAKGYSFCRMTGKWMAMIRRGGKGRFIGRFTTKEEAHAAYLEAKEELLTTLGA